jgi:hypothetical protein
MLPPTYIIYTLSHASVSLNFNELIFSSLVGIFMNQLERGLGLLLPRTFKLVTVCLIGSHMMLPQRWVSRTQSDFRIPISCGLKSPKSSVSPRLLS